MARVFNTCTVHAACQLETIDGTQEIHHPAQPQYASPNAPESHGVRVPRRRRRPPKESSGAFKDKRFIRYFTWNINGKRWYQSLFRRR